MKSKFASLAPDGRTVLWHHTAAPVRTPEEARKSADRKRRKEAKALPLFAPIIDQASERLRTPDEIIDRERSWQEQMAADELASYERAQDLRAIVAEYVTPEQLAAMDDRRFRVYPANVTYSWSFWFGRLKELAPERAAELCMNRERHEMMADWHERCPACGAALKTPTVGEKEGSE